MEQDNMARMQRLESMMERQELVSKEIIDHIKGNDRKNIIGLEPMLKGVVADVRIINQERQESKIRKEFAVKVFKWVVGGLGLTGTVLGILKIFITL